MWVATGVVVVLALAGAVSTEGSGARSSRAAALPRTAVVVTNTSDKVNGRVASVGALKAHPGRDGISLREALKAVDHTPGKATLYIMFSHRLNGKAIELHSQLPSIRRSHVVLEGVAPNGSPARVAIDGRRAPPQTIYALLPVQASDVTVRWLRFTGVKTTGSEAAMTVLPGPSSRRVPVGPKRLSNIRIEDNVFDNRGITYPLSGGPMAGGLIIAPFLQNPASRNARISAITIAGNKFLHYSGDTDAVGVWANSSGTTISRVVIEDNTFAQDPISIELGAGGKAPRQIGTRIIGNTITGGAPIGISLNTANAVDGVIAGTVIADNTISRVGGAAIDIAAEGYVNGLPGGAGSDVIANTQITNNVIRAGEGHDVGLYIAGGERTSSPISRVSGVGIENDTLVEDGTGSLMNVIPNGRRATGNQITGVIVRNSIFWDPNGEPITIDQPGSQAPNLVMDSLISGPGWAGSNGNINANPGFVNEPAADYHLAAGSPAINAGTTIGAPRLDIDGARRDPTPDIGAYEYGAAPRPTLTVTVYPLGGSGTVSSSPAGITCGTVCGAQFDSNTKVTLAAKPAKGSRFLGWRGACSGTHRCSLTLNGSKAVTARFSHR